VNAPLRLCAIAVLAVLAATAVAALAPTTAAARFPPRVVSADLRLHELRSRVFDNSRTLRVLVPPGYDDEAQAASRYPVLYLNDRQTLFGEADPDSTSGSWDMATTVRRLIERRAIEPLIVVGIENAGRRGRFREYFPWVDDYLQPPEPDPQGTRYPAFLLDEVVPFIEARYRVETTPARRGIGGASAVALAAMYAVVARPGTFGRLLVESPSVYVDDHRILREARAVHAWPSRIHLGVGTNETNAAACDATADPEAHELVRDVRALERVLRAQGVEPAQLQVVVTPWGRHEPAAWAERLPDALTFLFPSP